jgi:hypothetical protein
MSVTENDDPGRESGRGQLTAGIDWASEDHAVSIVDGRSVERDGSPSAKRSRPDEDVYEPSPRG